MREPNDLSAADTLKAARDPSHPLHGYITWDNAEAAEACRLDQARQLLQSIVVVSDS